MGFKMSESGLTPCICQLVTPSHREVWYCFCSHLHMVAASVFGINLKQTLALHTNLRQKESALCILSDKHNFHSLCLLSVQMEGGKEWKSASARVFFFPSVCSGLHCYCVVSYRTSNSSRSFSNTLSPPTSTLCHLLPFHHLPFSVWI